MVDKKTKRDSAVSEHEAEKKVTINLECCVCRKYISGMIVQALGKNWHPHHFICFKCKEPITSSKFNLHDGNAYCESDYAQMFLKKCYGCNLPIRDVVVQAMGQNWHTEHFVCCACGTKLANQSYYERENNPFCTTCYEEKFCPRCTLCNKPIVDTAVLALGNCWHQGCFKCNNCNEPISDTSFELYREKAVCSDCGKLLRKLKVDTTAF
ncbi:hypothetical protein O3M35_010482 [Rhynocoris fuscipes]|uniref:LIM zinc-binding domain-containing protein n=1 Tax=Rhynocoris fuscipes TaxID=488301 RepID=A0AAW1D565_9HEMI